MSNADGPYTGPGQDPSTIPNNDPTSHDLVEVRYSHSNGEQHCFETFINGSAIPGSLVCTSFDNLTTEQRIKLALAAEGESDAVDVAANWVTLRVGTKAEIRANAPKTADGDFIDPNTGQVIPKDGPFDYGHQPGYEWWRTQQIARDQGWIRQQLIEYENDASHFQIEDPASNRSHAFEMPR